MINFDKILLSSDMKAGTISKLNELGNLLLNCIGDIELLIVDIIDESVTRDNSKLLTLISKILAFYKIKYYTIVNMDRFIDISLFNELINDIPQIIEGIYNERRNIFKKESLGNVIIDSENIKEVVLELLSLYETPIKNN